MLVLYQHLFLGGVFTFGYETWLVYSVKFGLLILFYFNIRSILPNLRFDQVMTLHWKYILPINIIYLLILVEQLFFYF